MALFFFCIKCNDALLSAKRASSHTLQDNDGFAAVPVFAHICTAPVFDDDGCTDIVFATGDCSATANLQNPYTAK